MPSFSQGGDTLECQFGGIEHNAEADPHFCRFCKRASCGKGRHPLIIKTVKLGYHCAHADRQCQEARKNEIIKILSQVKPGDTIVVDGVNGKVMEKQPIERPLCHNHVGHPVAMIRVRVLGIPRWGCPSFPEH